MRKLSIVIVISFFFCIGIVAQASAQKIHCWDLNQNYTCDLATEDINNDSKCNSRDCTQNEPGGYTTDENTLYVGSDNDANEADSEVNFGTDATTKMTLYENGDLDVNGNITFSPSVLSIVGGEEQLRIIRGKVNANGTIATGSGFTVSRPTGTDPTGQYIITFNTPFSGNPTPVVTSDSLYRIPSDINFMIFSNDSRF